MLRLLTKNCTNNKKSVNDVGTSRCQISDMSRPRLFCGLLRVVSCKLLHTSTGKKYMRLQTDDSSGSIISYAWDKQYDGPWSFESMSIIQVRGKTRYYKGMWVTDLKEASIISDKVTEGSALLPFSKCPTPELLAELSKIESTIQNSALKSFVSDIMLDMDTAIPFMSVPGSLKHHHNEKGGLLRHSIESAQIASSIPLLDDYQRDLAIVGALLHDLGKIKVFSNMKRTNLGYLVDHQALTLEVCGKHISKLEDTCADTALALRHILTCRTIKRWGYEPRMAVAHVVQLADKLSVEFDMEKKSFLNTPDFRNVSNNALDASHPYWRALPK